MKTIDLRDDWHLGHAVDRPRDNNGIFEVIKPFQAVNKALKASSKYTMEANWEM